MTALAFDDGLQITSRLPWLLAMDSHESSSARPDESTPVTSCRLNTTAGDPSSKAARIAWRRPVSAVSLPCTRSTVCDRTRRDAASRDSIISVPGSPEPLPFLGRTRLREERFVDRRVVFDLAEDDARVLNR